MSFGLLQVYNNKDEDNSLKTLNDENQRYYLFNEQIMNPKEKRKREEKDKKDEKKKINSNVSLKFNNKKKSNDNSIIAI